MAPKINAPRFLLTDFKQRKLSVDRKMGQDRQERRGDSRRRDTMKVKTMGRDAFSIDKELVDLRYVEQLADSEQTSALAHLLRYGLEQVIDGRKTIQQIVEILWELIEKKGWEPFCGSYVPCGLAKPRKQELFACLNRFRG